MRLPSPSTELRDSAGLHPESPRELPGVTRTGTYYVGCSRRSGPCPGEQGAVGTDLAPLSPPRSAYRLTMTRRR